MSQPIFASTDAYLDLVPLRAAQGQMHLPGSKSISNRVLLLAALAQGKTRISGLLDSDDTGVMLAALRQLGVQIDPGASADQIVITGGCAFPHQQADIFLGNAGTAFRPLTAALALLGGDYHLHGVPRMHERPIGDLVDALVAMGADVRYQGQVGYPPLKIGKIQLTDTPVVQVNGQVSSQFLTALLLAAPLAQAKNGIKIQVQGELISKPYIEITLNLMARFGVIVERNGWNEFYIPPSVSYQSPGDIWIEGDASSASYFLALGAIAGGPIRVHGLGAQSIQGDLAFTDTLSAMGAKITKSDNWVECSGVQVAAGERLKAFDLDFNLIPDAAMTAAVLALYADGPCRLRNIASWRVKETDRIHAMQTELRKLGARVESGADWILVHPLGLEQQWHSAQIATWDDHRMAMCFSLAAFGGVGLRILDPNCVSKTFPAYFDVFTQLVQV